MQMDCNSLYCQYTSTPHFTSQQNRPPSEEQMSESGPGSPVKLFKPSFTIDSILGRQESDDKNKQDVDIVSVEINKNEQSVDTTRTLQTKQPHVWTPPTPSYNMMLVPGFGISPPQFPQPHRLLYRNQMCTCGDTGKYSHLALQLSNEQNYSGGIALVDPAFRHPLSFHECYFAGKQLNTLNT